MLAIRLARIGKKKQPTYRLTVSEKSKDTYGNALELLGHYNPRSKVCEVKKDRILHWISKGAQPSPTVHNLLVDQNVIEKEKVKASRSKQKNKKTEEQKNEKQKEAKKEESKPQAEEKKEEVKAEDAKNEALEVKRDVKDEKKSAGNVE